MALSGSYIDYKLEIFKDELSHELQQNDTVLLGTVNREKVGGLKTYFPKLGKLSSYEKTSRGQLKQPQDATYERRQVDFQPHSSDIIVDETDLNNMVGNPQSDYARAMRAELGRQIDATIFEALSGNATVITNDTSASTALPSASQIAVDNHAFDSGSGDIALTPGKLKAALALLGDAHVDVSRERVFVVGNMNQLMKLSTNSEVTSADFRNKKPLNIPGIVSGLDGYLGLTFIHYTGTDLVNTTDETVYVYPESAVKVGFRDELKMEAMKDPTRALNPISLSAWMDLGAVRMFEEKVIQIACDPTTI